MSNFMTVFVPVMKLAILIAAGFILRKKEILPSMSRKSLTDVVMFFLLPCNILNSFWKATVDESTFTTCLNVLILSIVLDVLAIIIGLVFFRTGDPKKDPVLRYSLMLPNANFLGSPLINSLYGATGTLYWSIYMIPYRIFMYTYGVAMFTKPDKNSLVKNLLLHPCFLCTIVGLIFMFTPLTAPKFLIDVTGYGSNTITALTMIIIGGILAEANWKDMVSKWSVIFAGVRLVFFPLLMAIICKLAKVDIAVAGVLTILSGTPAATMGTLFAEKYDMDKRLCAQAITLSTVCCLVTLPLMIVILNAIYAI